MAGSGAEHMAGGFRQFDILLEGDDAGGLVLATNLESLHVGNNRFEVLLNLHRSGYEVAKTTTGDTASIVEKVIDIVTNQFMPNGRFLLAAHPKGDSGPVTSATAVDWIEVSHRQVFEFVDKSLTLDKPLSFVDLPVPVHNKTQGGESAGVADAEDSLAKKRGRRSSLLRRSTSESMLGMAQHIADKKKINRKEGKRTSMYRNNNGFLSELDAVGVVSEPLPLDIIFTEDLQGLRSDHTGNNRLKISFMLQQQRYKDGTPHDRVNVVRECIETVNKAWNGRFLRPDEELPDTYEVLEDGDIEKALHTLLNNNTFAGPGAPSVTSSSNSYYTHDNDDTVSVASTVAASVASERSGTSMRSAMSESTMRSTRSAMSTSTMASSVMSEPIHTRFKIDSLVAMSKSITGVDDANRGKNQQSAAVAALRERRKRQQQANKIRSLAETTRRGESSRLNRLSLSRATSAPVGKSPSNNAKGGSPMAAFPTLQRATSTSTAASMPPPSSMGAMGATVGGMASLNNGMHADFSIPGAAGFLSPQQSSTQQPTQNMFPLLAVPERISRAVSAPVEPSRNSMNFTAMPMAMPNMMMPNPAAAHRKSKVNAISDKDFGDLMEKLDVSGEL